MQPVFERIARYITALLACMAGIFIFFRSFFLSDGDLIIGDLADGMLIQSIHEHWFKVYQGLNSWLDMGFFYPVSNELGFSDTYLLSGIPYTIMRALGVEMFLAYELTQMLLLVGGFVGMYYWLARCRGIQPWISIWGAFLFVVASPFFLNARNSHIQVLSVWIVPVVMILLEAFIKSYRAHAWKPCVLFSAICLIYGALMYSTFYAGFFLALGILLLLLSSLIIFGPEMTFKTVIPPKRIWIYLAPGLVVMALWIGLFLWTYIPVHRDHGGHSLMSVLSSIPNIWDLFNHSTSNLLWGDINSLLWEYDAEKHWVWTYELGLTPVLAAVAVVISISVLRNRQSWKQKAPGILLGALLFVSVLVLMIKVGGVALWAFIYYLLPGADVIRVIPRINAALMVPAVYLVCYFIQDFFRNRSVLMPFMGALLMVVVTLEQFQDVGNSSISRAERNSLYERTPPPPADADVAFFLGEPAWGWHPDVTINSAMYLSQMLDIPTVNGRSGMSPPNWLMREMGVNVGTWNLVEWARIHDMTEKVYYYNMESGEWIGAIDFSMTADTFSSGQELLHLKPSEFTRIAYSGWHELEKGGVWSSGSLSRLKFSSIRFNGNEQIRLTMQGFVSQSSQVRRVKILVNNVEVFSIDLTLDAMTREVVIPLNGVTGTSLEVDFIVDNPVRPADVGFNNDQRELGLRLQSFVIRD